MAKTSNLLCPFQKLVTNKTVTSFCNGLDVDTSFCHGQGYKTEKILVFAMDDIFKFCKKWLIIFLFEKSGAPFSSDFKYIKMSEISILLVTSFCHGPSDI